MDLLIPIALVFFAGIFCNYVTKKLHLPTIIGYLVVGMIMGPYVLNLISERQLIELELFSSIALCFISFSIGSEFKLKFIRKLGLTPLVIALISSLSTFALVTVLLTCFGMELSFALILGAIASSTAPPAIMMIIKEYKAKGPLTDMMLSVIALDDVISILLFGFTLAIAQNMNQLTPDLVAWLEPFREIVLALLIGSVLGLLLGRIERFLKTEMDMALSTIALLFLLMGISEYLDISSLLVAMVMGFTFVNTTPNKITGQIVRLTDTLTPPLFILFFVVSGASLNIYLLPEIGIIGIVFIVARTVGKVGGAMIGAMIMKCDSKITKFLGPSLLSETGIAIGLALIASESLPSKGSTLQAIVIASSFLFDLTGPFIVKTCLKRAGEIERKKRRFFYRRKTLPKNE